MRILYVEFCVCLSFSFSFFDSLFPRGGHIAYTLLRILGSTSGAFSAKLVSGKK